MRVSRHFSLLVSFTLSAGMAISAGVGVMYEQDFDSLNAVTNTGTASPTDVMAELATIDWSLYSIAPWNHERTRTIEDAGGGDMVVTEDVTFQNDTGGAPQKAALIYKPTPFPVFQDVTVTGYLEWNRSPGTYERWSGAGLIVRANASAAATSSSQFGGNFYMVRLIDNNDPSYGVDSIQLLRVIAGVESILAGSVEWKNGLSRFEASQRAGYLRVKILNVSTNVQVEATYSSDPTFKIASQEIITGTWTDTNTNKITTGGTVGFGHSSWISHYNQPTKFTWDDMLVTRKLGGTVIIFK